MPRVRTLWPKAYLALVAETRYSEFTSYLGRRETSAMNNCFVSVAKEVESIYRRIKSASLVIAEHQSEYSLYSLNSSIAITVLAIQEVSTTEIRV